MPITRKFLDWREPALSAVVDVLCDEFAILGVLDLENVVVVLPGSRAGRRLLELLVERAEKRLQKFTPPQIITIGTLPELLYEPKRPFAGDLVQKLAWGQALRRVEPGLISRIIPKLPAEDDFAGWLSLGDMLWRQHRELAAEGMNFAEVVQGCSTMGGDAETDRWQILRKVQLEYLQTLDDLQLWDLQTARLFAIEHHECRTEREIVLVGTVDMNRALRQMLDQVAEKVTALIHAPPELAERFDVYGCIDPKKWQNVLLELTTDQVCVVDDPSDQADAVARSIADYEGAYRADEITIGLLDEQIVPQVQRQLSQCGLPSRWVIGKSLPATAPFRLLAAMADYIGQGRFDDFAAVVRHPDVSDWLARQGFQGDWLTQLDKYYHQHLQPQLGEWLGNAEHRDQIEPIHASVQQLADTLRGKSRKLGEWVPRIVQLLLDVYSDVEFELNDPVQRITVAACRQIHSILTELQKIPESLSPPLTAAQAIQLLLAQLESGAIPPMPDEAAIELLGWLELPLDDTPALIVTTFNEGYVPKSVNSDLFLPNGLRQRLGLVDNARRYARDAYALSVLLASRQDLTLIVGRRNSRDDSLAPSRLLFATQAENIARRVLVFFESDDAPKPPLAAAFTPTRETSGFYVPKPAQLPDPVTEMSVTEFRSYLACPYRFYLRHMMKLSPLDDAAKELDAASFGILIHEVLKRFGRSDLRHSIDAAEIRDFLYHALRQCLEERYGDVRMAAVNVQAVQLRVRLDAFSQWQAEWAREGWQIEHTEVSERGVLLPVDDRSITLRGRIDRIDRHRDTGEWIVFDYKSGDTAKSPQQVHRKGKEWVDLQLPLYRRLVSPLGMSGPLKLGYIALPKDKTKVGDQLADWTEAELDVADDVAKDVARRVLNQEFWPPAEPPPRLLSDYAAVCQEAVFEKVFEADVEVVR